MDFDLKVPSVNVKMAGYITYPEFSQLGIFMFFIHISIESMVKTFADGPLLNSSWQFWLPRPYLPGASDRGAKRKRHHGWLTSMKMTKSSKTFWDLLSALVVDRCQPKDVLGDCPSLGYLKTKPTADRCLMLQSPPHFGTFSSVFSLFFSSRVQLNPVLHVEENTLSAVHSCIAQSFTCCCLQ